MQRPKLTRVITFRVSDGEWFEIQRAAEQSGITPNEWCCTMALERLNLWCGLSHNQVLLFVENAFALLAEDKLQPNVWRSHRHYARGNLRTILEQALAECSRHRKELLGAVDTVGIER
jgi:hypothetical protein